MSHLFFKPYKKKELYILELRYVYPCGIPLFYTLPLVTNNYKIIYLYQVNKKIEKEK